MYVLRFTVWSTIICVSDWKNDYFHIFSFVLHSVNQKVLEQFLFTHRVALKNLTSFAALTHSFFFDAWQLVNENCLCTLSMIYSLCPSRVSGLTSELRLLKCQSFVQTKALLGTSLTWMIRVHVHDQLLMLLWWLSEKEAALNYIHGCSV